MVDQYTHVQRSLAVAGAERYGVSAVRKLLSVYWANVPAAATIKEWMHGGQVEVHEQDREFWLEYEGGRRARLQAAMEERFEATMGAYDDFVAERDAKSMRDSAVSMGIIYDKLVPATARGGLSVAAGEGGTVNLIVVQGGSDGSARRPVGDGA